LKQDIDLLICVLRLRCQPPIPYSAIASYLLDAFTVPILRRAGFNVSSVRDIPKGFDIEKQTAGWMEKNLPEIFAEEEKKKSRAWRRAKKWDGELVRVLLKISELDEVGYEVVGREEMEVQIEWRKTGDWKAGSVPWEGFGGGLKESVFGRRVVKRMSADLNRDTIRLLRPESHPEIFRPGFGGREKSRTVGSEDTVLFSPPSLTRRDAVEDRHFPDINPGSLDHPEDPFSHHVDRIESLLKAPTSEILGRNRRHRSSEGSWPLGGIGGWLDMTS
jgi:hypothetical protein